MRRALPVALLASLATIGGGWEAQACSCDPLTPAQALDLADAAFTGIVISVVDAPAKADPRTVTFQVGGVYKGGVGPVASVQTPREPGACGIDFVPSETYTVLARSERGRLVTGICDATATGATLLRAVASPEPPGGGPPEPEGRGTLPLLALALALGVAAGLTWARRRRALPGK